MTIRLLCSYEGCPVNSIITLDAGTETGLVNAKMATTDLTGGTPLVPPVGPAQTPRQPFKVRALRSQQVALTEGMALTVTGAAGTAGTVTRLDANDSALQTWTVGAGPLAPIGPYSGTQKVLITCTAGSIDAEVGDAVLQAVSIAAVQSGDIAQQPIGVPRGVNWLSDTVPQVDLYARGYGVTPTIFFDPTAAATSRNLGTYKNPYTTIKHLMLAFKGSQPGQVLGIKRGTVTRVGLLGGLLLSVCGSKNAPAFIVPYGDAQALPIITGGEIVTDWTVHSGTAGVDAIYKRTMAFDTDVWQSDTRVLKVANVAAIDAPGKSTYVGGVLYFRPLSNENPNLGQIELPWCDYTTSIRFPDVAETGYVRTAGIDFRKARNISFDQRPVAGASAITAMGGVHVVGCRFGQAGYDFASNNIANDAMLIYGFSDTVRATGCYIAGNEAYESLNNAYEVGAMDGLIMESNYGRDVGGNSILELWWSCSNSRIRDNNGVRAGLVSRLYNGFHAGGIWQAAYTNAAGTTKSNTSHNDNWYHHNVIADSAIQGIDIYSGSGNKVLHNTLYNRAETITNRLVNMFTNGNVSGACDVEVSNNIAVIGNSGNRKVVDVACGAVTNDAGFAITATISGDNNAYLNHQSPSQSLRLRTPAGLIDVGASTDLATYKAALVTAGSTFDQNSIAPFAPANPASNYIGSDYVPTSLLKTAGKTGYTALTRYNDGLPYDPTSCAIGALGA